MTQRKDPARAIRGRVSRAVGLDLEERLDAYHATLTDAHVRRVGTPHRVVGKPARGVFKVAMTGHQGCDFAGWVRLSPASLPMPVVLEAKTHDGFDAWSMQAIDEHQRAELHAYAAAGCLALVVLEAWGSGWLFEWARLSGHRAARSRWTVRPDEAETLGRRLRGVAWWESEVWT